MYKVRNRIPQYPPLWAGVLICFLLLAACGPSVGSYKEQRTPKLVSKDWTGHLRGGDHSGINKNEDNMKPYTARQLKLHGGAPADNRILSQPVRSNGLTYWGPGGGLEHA